MENGNEIKNTTPTATKKVVLVGVLSATLTAGKLALAFIPNVEIVTVLILVYATVLGRKTAVFSALVFSAVEVLIYGFNTWVVLYFIYWPMLAVVGGTFLKKPRIWVAVVIGIVMSFLFGVLDALIVTIFAAFGGVSMQQILRIFVAYYIRGIWFYAVHIVSNAIVVGSLYFPLVLAFQKIRASI